MCWSALPENSLITTLVNVSIGREYYDFLSLPLYVSVYLKEYLGHLTLLQRPSLQGNVHQKIRTGLYVNTPLKQEFKSLTTHLTGFLPF